MGIFNNFVADSKKSEKGQIMIKFIGEYDSKLDEKGRAVVPSAFKAIVSKELSKENLSDISFVIKKSLFANCLEMYTYEQWEQESEQIKARLNFFNPEHDKFWREYSRERAFVTLDQKVGRIIIPKSLLTKIGVKKEIVFAGNDFKIEIWAKEKYAKTKMKESEFVNLATKILG